MKISEYFARPGSGFTDQDASVVGNERDRITKKLGHGPTTREFFDAQKDEEAACHGYFNWDKDEVHRQYGERRAGELMGMVETRYIDASGHEGRHRAFFAIPVEGTQRDGEHLRRYEEVEVIREEPAKAACVIEEAWGNLQGWRRRYQIYRERLAGFEDRFGGVFKAIEEAENPSPPAAAENGKKPAGYAKARGRRKVTAEEPTAT